MGLLLVPMGTAAGGRLIGTASTEEKADPALVAGADVVLRSDEPDLVDQVRKLTAGHGVAAVYDGVGRNTFDTSHRCLRRRGMLVLFGVASGPVPPFDPQLLGKNPLYLTAPARRPQRNPRRTALPGGRGLRSGGRGDAARAPRRQLSARRGRASP
jgi:NADPH2:quinone reductase